MKTRQIAPATSFLRYPAAVALLLAALPVMAQSTYYWNTVTTNLWQTGANWSNNAVSGGTTGTVPLSTDFAVFNQSNVNGNEIIQLNGTTSIAGLTFNNTGTTTLQSDTSGSTRVLNIGASGITVGSGAGNVIFGVTNFLVTPTLSASQIWTNNSAVGTLTMTTGTLAVGVNTLTLAGAGNFSLNTVTSTAGSGVLDATQTGSLSLGASSNSFFGTLNTGQNSGTLLLGSNTVLGGAGATVNIKGGTIATNATGARALVAATSVNGDFILGQAATGTGIATLSGAMNLNAASRQITVNNASSIISGAVSNGGITKAGTGILTLGNATNAYAGNTAINAGTLQFTNNGAGSTTAAVTVTNAGSTLAVNYGGGSDYTQAQVGTLLAKTTFTTNTTAFGFDTTNGSGTYGAVFNIAAGVTKLGANSLTLNQANTYTGATTVSAGTLQAGIASVANVSGAFGNNSAITLANTAGATLDLNGFNTQIGSLAGGGSTGGNVTLGAAILTTGASNTITSYAGVISGSGGVTKIGTGTQTFTGNANTYTGLTTVSEGNLTLSKATGVDALAADVLVNGTGTLTITNPDQIKNTANVEVATGGTFGIGGNSETVNGLKLTGGATTGNAGNLTSTTTIDFQSGSSGAKLTGTAGANKTTSGTVSLSGASSYSGGTTLTAGTLQLGVASVGSVGTITSSAVGTGTLTLNGGTLSSASTTSRTILNAVTIGGDVTLGDGNSTGALTFSADADLGSSTRTLTTASAVTFSGNITGTGGMTKAGSGTLTYNGATANTYSGLTTVGAGSLTLAKTATVDAIAGDVLVNGTGTLTLGASDQIKNTSNVEVATGGTFALGANNETVNGVKLTGGAITSTGNLTSSTDFDLQSGSAAAFLAGAVAATKTTAGTVVLSRTNTYTGATTISGGTLQIGAGGNTGSIDSTSGVTNNSALVYNRSNTPTVSYAIGGNGTLEQQGSGTLTLTGTNTYTGATTISAGTLQIGNGGTSGSIATTTGVTNNAALVYNRSNDLTASYPIGGTGTLTKQGNGTLTLTGNNGYTGTTTVTAGTLELSGTGSINSSANIIVNGGTFKNNSSVNLAATLTFTSGTVGGTNLTGVAITVGTGNILSPGNSPGTMDAGATTFADGGTYLFEINNAGGTAGTNWDLLNATTLDITAPGGGFTVKLASLVNPTNVAGAADGFVPDVSKSFLFVDTGSAITSFSATAFTVNTTLFTNTVTGTWAIARGDTVSGGDNTQLYVTYTVVPEPSGYAALAGLGMVGFALYRRRRQQKAAVAA